MSEKIYQATSDGSLQEVSLPEYVCHKVVRAAKIVAIGIGPEPGVDAVPSARRGVRLALEGAAHVDVSQLWMQTKSAQPGGYFVQYEDGYSSFSPAKAFEEGYVAAPADGDHGEESQAKVISIDLLDLVKLSMQVATVAPQMDISPSGTIKSATALLGRVAGGQMNRQFAVSNVHDLDLVEAAPVSVHITRTGPGVGGGTSGGTLPAADPNEPRPTGPAPREIPLGAIVQIKGGNQAQFKVAYCDQINGRRFVALEGLPELFHENDIVLLSAGAGLGVAVCAEAPAASDPTQETLEPGSTGASDTPDTQTVEATSDSEPLPSEEAPTSIAQDSPTSDTANPDPTAPDTTLADSPASRPDPEAETETQAADIQPNPPARE